MGNFRVEINGVGGHGCDRAAKEGEAITLPGLEAQEYLPSRDDEIKYSAVLEEHVRSCPDCRIRQVVEEFRAAGWFHYGGDATLTHWPGESGEVVDDLLAMKRQKGQF